MRAACCKLSIIEKQNPANNGGAQRNFVEAIHTRTERLTSIVNAISQCLEIAQGTLKTHPQQMDVGAIMAETVGRLRQKFVACDLEVSMEAPDDLPAVHADPVIVQQILEQLLDNAMRFTPADGRVSARAEPRGGDGNAGEATWIAITVQDTGVGLALADQERIFERFYRAENPLQVPAGGLGIGLWIARALALGQGGQLEVASPGATDSQPGQGSIFALLLLIAPPLIAAPAQKVEDAIWMEELEGAIASLSELC